MGIVAIGIVVHGFDLPMRRDKRPVVPSKAKARPGGASRPATAGCRPSA